MFSENKQQQLPGTILFALSSPCFRNHFPLFTLHLTLPDLTGEKSSMQAFVASLGLIAYY